MGEALRIETNPATGDRERATGASGTVINLGQIAKLDDNPEVHGTRWYGDGMLLGIARQMCRDPHVKRSLEAIVDPLLAAYWDFNAASKCSRPSPMMAA